MWVCCPDATRKSEELTVAHSYLPPRRAQSPSHRLSIHFKNKFLQSNFRLRFESGCREGARELATRATWRACHQEETTCGRRLPAQAFSAFPPRWTSASWLAVCIHTAAKHCFPASSLPGSFPFPFLSSMSPWVWSTPPHPPRYFVSHLLADLGCFSPS